MDGRANLCKSSRPFASKVVTFRHFFVSTCELLSCLSCDSCPWIILLTKLHIYCPKSPSQLIWQNPYVLHKTVRKWSLFAPKVAKPCPKHTSNEPNSVLTLWEKGTFPSLTVIGIKTVKGDTLRHFSRGHWQFATFRLPGLGRNAGFLPY